MKCIDCATDTTPHIPKIKDAGIGIVIRYFGSSAWKCADKAECDALKKAGIDIAAVYETTADMMLSGYEGGVRGAIAVEKGLAAAGAPKDAFVYFACDTDTHIYAAVEDYLKGAASILGAARVGIYGSYDICAHALGNKRAAKAWQTRAWSAGKRLAAAALYQDNGSTAYGELGFGYDINLVQMPDVGQWGYVAPVLATNKRRVNVPRLGLHVTASVLSQTLDVMTEDNVVIVLGYNLLRTRAHVRHDGIEGWCRTRTHLGKLTLKPY